MSAKLDQLTILRNSTEHVLTMAMENLYGKKIIKAMGPATADGFYFDFDSPKSFKLSESDFPKIESEMHRLIALDLPISVKLVSPSNARQMFKDNPYKQELLDEILKKDKQVRLVIIGKQGTKEYFPNICKDQHLKSTGQIKAFKLLSLAGAYWHGDEKNKMLTRIYGTAFPSQKELDHYLWQLEEAKKRDHRQLGKQLDIYFISDQIGPGLPLWLPKGNIIKDQLENWAKQTEKDWGYQAVSTPHVTKAGLYYTSGHLPYYKDDMFPAMKLDKNEDYYLKPMNCPHHHMIFAARPRSYKELPLRLAEYGQCYRYEASGELFGLMRVRSMDMNDAHIYCTQEQAVKEFVDVIKLHQHYYHQLGIKKYHLELALRDPQNKKKYHGDESMWRLAEKLMRQAVKQVDIPLVEEQGSAAFYGPKIDFIIESSIGRQFAISTNQIDLFMGKRFQLKYTDQNGNEKTPVIIHRAPLGTHERFIGFLLEHFGGAFPTWLAPVQVIVIPISDSHHSYAKKVADQLKQADIRVELDDRSHSMQARIRDAQVQKVPYMLILGDQELKSKTVSPRNRSGQDSGPQSLDKFITNLRQEIDKKIIN